MSSNENVDPFEALMNSYSDDGSPPEEAVEQEVVEEVDDGEDSTAALEDEAPEEEDHDDEESPPDEDADEDVEEDPVPKKGKKSARERINEVVAQRRQAERERDAERALAEAEKTRREELEERLRQLEEGTEKPKAKAPDRIPAGDEFGLTEQTANDVDDDGEAKYPLGEFDPKFTRDLARYDRAVERAYEAKVNAQKAQEREAMREAEALFEDWNKKLTKAEETSPKIRQKAANLVDTFADVPAEHGQALAQAIMTLDNGPAVLEYLADNLDEADEIIKLPQARALIRLGKLDALFIEEVEKAPPVKQTKAPPPPAALARGRGTASSGGQKSLYDKMLQEFR